VTSRKDENNRRETRTKKGCDDPKSVDHFMARFSPHEVPMKASHRANATSGSPLKGAPTVGRMKVFLLLTPSIGNLFSLC